MANSNESKTSTKKVKKARRTVDEIMQPFRSYEKQKHDKPNPLRLEELLAIILSANQAKKDLDLEIEDACKEMGKEIKRLRSLQDKILKDAGVIPRRKRKKSKPADNTGENEAG